MFTGKAVMVIGGTGTLGIRLCQVLLQRYPQLKRLVVYSRNKERQAKAASLLKRHPIMKFYLGDVLHRRKLVRAMAGIDYVVSAGEFRQGEDCSPSDLLGTYIRGTENIIAAALANNVAKVITLSNQQACNPTNLKGLGLLCREKLTIAANSRSRLEGKQTGFSVLRYGRSLNQPGGIIYQLQQSRDSGCLSLSNVDGTRYWFTLDQGAAWVLKSIALMRGGETIVPQTASIRLLDIAKAICPLCQIKLVRDRLEEKQHDLLITQDEAARTLEFPDYYIIQPDFPWWDSEEYTTATGAKDVADGFYYSSANNNFMLGPEEMEFILKRK